MTSGPHISVVVPTLGRYNLLKNCLESIQKQSYRDFELIVVHDGDKGEALKELVDSNGGIFLRSPRPGCVPTYNAGLEASSGKVIAFTDDDAVPDPGWLAQLVGTYHEGVGGVGGLVIEARGPRDSPFVINRTVSVDHLSGANMSFAREAVDKTGGFDHNYNGDGFRFESDYCIRVKRLGFEIIFNPRARVIHLGSGVRRVPRGWNIRRAYYHNRNNTYFSLKNLAVPKTPNRVVYETRFGMTIRVLRSGREMAKEAFASRDRTWVFGLVGLASGVRVYVSSRIWGHFST